MGQITHEGLLYRLVYCPFRSHSSIILAVGGSLDQTNLCSVPSFLSNMSIGCVFYLMFKVLKLVLLVTPNISSLIEVGSLGHLLCVGPYSLDYHILA